MKLFISKEQLHQALFGEKLTTQFIDITNFFWKLLNFYRRRGQLVK